MPVSYVRYDLQNGYVHNWLIAGPQEIPVSALDRFSGKDAKLRIARNYFDKDSGIVEMPVEPGSLTEARFAVGDYKSTWSYVRCLQDHFVDLSAYYCTCRYLRAWAYAQVELPTAQEVELTLTTNGPADVWLNEDHVHRHEHFCHYPRSASFGACLVKGRNEILVRFEEVALRECPYVMALQIVGLAEDGGEATVLLPTTIEDVERRDELERLFEAAYLDQSVYRRKEQIVIRWPDHLYGKPAYMTARLQTPSGKIYTETQIETIEANMNLGPAYKFPENRYNLVLMPEIEEYYLKNTRIKRKLSLWGLDNNDYSDEPYGTFQERRAEALMRAARCEDNPYAEIAKMALGWWARVDNDTILKTIEGINERKDRSVVDLIGLLGMSYRSGNEPEFPDVLRQSLEDCILVFRYWRDEPGSDMTCYTRESLSILFHTCEILAGQIYPDRVFTNAEETGEWHRRKGERLALDWLYARGRRGFEEWDSNRSFEEDLLALSHLEEFAQDDEIRELAAVMMDKIFFQIAVNSYKGVFGSTHGHTLVSLVKGGLLEATSGISRLMWGMGVFNHHIRGVVSLACMQEYQFPRIIQNIAVDLPEEIWSRERHAPDNPEEGVNKVTYKTPDYMLCSAQDHHPGERGDQQHIWQATMGPAAVVFVTHPPCESEKNSHRTNFWCGNYVLPRVAQWKDVLIAIHDLSENDWMGFTHAYFPIHAFDQYDLREGWAFARKGDAYLALTVSQGLELTATGDHAYQELRSYGEHNIWVCHMGRAALDGDFHAFQDKILALDTIFDDLSVQCDTLRGETLAFGWQGPFMRDGKQQAISGFKHYENPYCVAELPTTEMDIRFGEWLMRLHFSE